MKTLLLLTLPVLLAAPAAAQAPQRSPGEGFARLDTDGSNSISRAEWEAAGRKPQGFDRLDANRDGQLTQAEIADAMATLRARRGGGSGKAGGFARADANGDGRVTQAEWRAQSDARFAALDTNRDGAITPEEMAAARQRQPLP
jgi:hypothetical protein